MIVSKMALNSTSLFGQVDDLQDLAFIERPVRRSLKTAEEIQQLTVDEELNEIERAVYLLSSGHDVQKASVLINLPNLVRQNPAETFRRVVPKVREVLNVAGAEIHLVAAASLLTVLQDDIILIHTHTYSILKTVLQNLNHSETVVSNAWLETLLSAIKALPKETIKQEILNPLVYKPQLTQSVNARLASCRILGRVAGKFDSVIVQKELVPMARSLCQDVEYEVRSCMCRQLENIAQGIGTENTRFELLPELLELAGDEEGSVRLAALDTIIRLLEMMDRDDRIQVIFPLVSAICDLNSQLNSHTSSQQNCQADEAVLTSLSFQFGKLCHGLSGLLSSEQRCWLLQLFKKLCAVGLHDDNTALTLVRCNCSYNLPAMVVFADPSYFLAELYPSFSNLCRDPEVSVRRTTADGFHQIAQLLGPKVHLIHKELIALLLDDSLEVLDALLNHMQKTLELTCSTGESKWLPELLAGLLAAEQKASLSLRWRLHEKLLRCYSCLLSLLPGDHIYQHFYPRIFSILTTNKVLPVQREAARTLCMFLRYNRQLDQRKAMIDRMLQELAQGRSYWYRLRYLDVCEIAIELFSKAYFSKNFLIPALELVNDPIANVRYKLCNIMSKLRSSIQLPADKQLLQQLDFCFQELLCREKDKDVVAIIRQTVLELDKVDITEPYHKRQERDLLDQQKELEETLILDMGELEKQQNEPKPNGEKHSEKKRRDSKSRIVPCSTSGSCVNTSTGKEVRKAKLSRSRSLSSQPTKAKPSSLEKSGNSNVAVDTSGFVSRRVPESGDAPDPVKTSRLPGNDNCLRTAQFTMATASLSSTSSTSMPVLIRRNTTSALDHRTSPTQDPRTSNLEPRTSSTLDPRTSTTLDPRTSSTLDPRTSSNLDHRSSNLDHRSSTLDHRTLDHRTSSNLDHRTSTLDHRTSSNLDHRSSNLEHRTSNLDHRSSNLDHRSSNLDHRSSTLDHRTSSNLDHRTSTLDHRTSSNLEHRTSNLDHRTSTLDHRTLDHRTSSNLDHRSSTLDHRTLDHRSSTLDHRTLDHRTSSTLDHRTSSNLDHRTSTLDHRTPSTLDHRTSSNLDHRTSTLDHRSSTLEQRSINGSKESQSRKLSIHRKSKLSGVPSGRD